MVPIGTIRVLPPDGARVRFLPGAPQTRRGFDSCLGHRQRRWFPHPPIPVRDRDPHQVLDPSPCHPMDQHGADWHSPRTPTRRGEGSIPAWGTDSAVGFLTPRSLFGIGTPIRSSTLHLATQWISMVPDWHSPRTPTRRGEGSIPAWGTDRRRRVPSGKSPPRVLSCLESVSSLRSRVSYLSSAIGSWTDAVRELHRPERSAAPSASGRLPGRASPTAWWRRRLGHQPPTTPLGHQPPTTPAPQPARGKDSDTNPQQPPPHSVPEAKTRTPTPNNPLAQRARGKDSDTNPQQPPPHSVPEAKTRTPTPNNPLPTASQRRRLGHQSVTLPFIPSRSLNPRLRSYSYPSGGGGSGEASVCRTRRFTGSDHVEDPCGAADGGGQSAPMWDPSRRGRHLWVMEPLDPLRRPATAPPPERGGIRQGAASAESGRTSHRGAEQHSNLAANPRAAGTQLGPMFSNCRPESFVSKGLRLRSL